MERIILELIKESGGRPDYRVFSDLVVRIGRGYDNHLILSDPHVSKHHCLIRAHEDGFTLEDLSSVNGTWMIETSSEKFQGRPVHTVKDKHMARVEKSVRIMSGDTIVIGRTRLRFIISGHEVEPAKPILKPHVFFQEISSSVKSWLLVTCAVFLSCAIEHQESYKNLPLSKFISIGIGLLLTILVWAGIWSFIGWLIKRRAHFNAHLSWATLFFLAMTITYPIADQLGYVASSQKVELIVGAVFFWFFIALLIAGHLMIATFIARRYQIAVAVGLSLIVVIFGVVTYYAGKPDFSAQPDLYSTLVPPYGKLAIDESVDQFVNKSNEIFLIKTDGR